MYYTAFLILGWWVRWYVAILVAVPQSRDWVWTWTGTCQFIVEGRIKYPSYRRILLLSLYLTYQSSDFLSIIGNELRYWFITISFIANTWHHCFEQQGVGLIRSIAIRDIYLIRMSVKRLFFCNDLIVNSHSC